MVKPEHFLEDLWKLVEPWEKSFVCNRYARYEPERVSKIVADIECGDKLDIEDRKLLVSAPWNPELQASEGDYLRAQTLANLDAYFHPKETDILAHDVVGEIDLKPDAKPFRCRPRRWSYVL